MKSYPLSYIFSGEYFWPTGKLSLQSLDSGYWSSTVHDNSVFRVYMSGNVVRYINNSARKSFGYSVRCAKISCQARCTTQGTPEKPNSTICAHQAYTSYN